MFIQPTCRVFRCIFGRTVLCTGLHRAQCSAGLLASFKVGNSFLFVRHLPSRSCQRWKVARRTRLLWSSFKEQNSRTGLFSVFVQDQNSRTGLFLVYVYDQPSQIKLFLVYVLDQNSKTRPFLVYVHAQNSILDYLPGPKLLKRTVMGLLQ